MSDIKIFLTEFKPGDNKYKLLKDDCIKYLGKTLYRIQYLDGYLGGYIASENNVSQQSICRVYMNMRVF